MAASGAGDSFSSLDGGRSLRSLAYALRARRSRAVRACGPAPDMADTSSGCRTARAATEENTKLLPRLVEELAAD